MSIRSSIVFLFISFAFFSVDVEATTTARGLVDTSATPTPGVRGIVTVSRNTTGPVTLDFEGLLDQEPIANYYNGGAGGNGSSFGTSYGISFSANALALIDSDSGGSGDFGGEPSSSTILFFASGSSAYLNVNSGFSRNVSFHYSAINSPGFVEIYDGASGSGRLLKEVELPITPVNGAPDPTGAYSPFNLITIEFGGAGRSVVFSGAADRIAIDDLTLVIGAPQGEAVLVPASSPFLLMFLGLAIVGLTGLVNKARLRRKMSAG